MSPERAAAAIAAIADPALVVFENPACRPGAAPDPLAERYARERDAIARALSGAPGYAPTPCHRLDRLAQAIGCSGLVFKDEGPRFGLGSFKSAGVAYAMIRHIERRLGRTVDPARAFRRGYADELRGEVFATATAGNHGRALAWASRLVGARCMIYAPLECSANRRLEMAGFGAEIVDTGLLYNPSMLRCREDCERNGWTLFSDTSFEDYREIPDDITLGYAHIIAELAPFITDWGEVSHMVVQGGVGAFAAGLVTGLSAFDPQRRIEVVIVEPAEIAALQASARRGAPTGVTIRDMSLMTGISNAGISVAAWPVLRSRVRWFVGLHDASVRPTMRYFAEGGLDGVPIEVGETGTAGTAAWLSLMRPPFREAIGYRGGTALVFGCEGVTDRAIYERLLAEPA